MLTQRAPAVPAPGGSTPAPSLRLPPFVQDPHRHPAPCLFYGPHASSLLLAPIGETDYTILMEQLTIEILNPKAKGILKSLADLDLISIRKGKTETETFKNLLKNLRSGSPAPDPAEIAREVEIVRAKRHAAKNR